MSETREARLEAAIRWALGESGDFGEEPPPLAGKYRQRFWWRTELRRRAGLGAEVPPEPPTVAVRAVGRCPECGPVVAIDAEGCCQGCGHDVVLSAPTPEPERPAVRCVWQPIETAPKDGRWVLLALQGGAKAHIGSWERDGWEKDGEGLSICPTHWMPLPDPPEDTHA